MSQQNQQKADPQAGRQGSTDREGSQTGSEGRETGTEPRTDISSDEVHESNDVAGGLPRSPGNAGPRSEDQGWLPGQSVKKEEQDSVRQSNDVGGGLPKSPAGANRLAGDRKMDDDTGFSRG